MPTFSADERIKSRKILEQLYEKGEGIKHFPYKLKYLRMTFDTDPKVKIVISVPKRNVKLAVRRNRLRRQIKESYRLNKADLLKKMGSEDEGLALFLVYVGKEDLSYRRLEVKLIELLEKLQKKI